MKDDVGHCCIHTLAHIDYGIFRPLIPHSNMLGSEFSVILLVVLQKTVNDQNRSDYPGRPTPAHRSALLMPSNTLPFTSTQVY